MMTYTDAVRQLLDTLRGQPLTLNQLVRLSRIARPKVITLLARLVRFGIVDCRHHDQQFLFSVLP